jgi:hypothetical protein
VVVTDVVAAATAAAAVTAADGVCRPVLPVSPSAGPAPFPLPLPLPLLLLFCCLVSWDVPRWAKKTWRAVAWVLAGPL